MSHGERPRYVVRTLAELQADPLRRFYYPARAVFIMPAATAVLYRGHTLQADGGLRFSRVVVERAGVLNRRGAIAGYLTARQLGELWRDFRAAGHIVDVNPLAELPDNWRWPL